jgi:hypothetical protein
MMERRALDAIDALCVEEPTIRTCRDQTMPSPLGDLVVLINPASEAKKWTSLQRALRARAGLDDSQPWVRGDFDAIGERLGATPEEAAKLNAWRDLFAIEQRPVYVSVTAAREWHDTEGEAHHDWVTEQVFPLSRIALGRFAQEERMTIGHLHARYGNARSDGETQNTIIMGAPVGASHDYQVNRSLGVETSYANAGAPMLSWCGLSDGWLRQAIELSNGVSWDSDYGATGRITPSLLRLGHPESESRISLQMRNALALAAGQGAESPAPMHSPFWNMRAHSNAVRDHNIFQSYPFWCGLNALFLDDPTAG